MPRGGPTAHAPDRSRSSNGAPPLGKGCCRCVDGLLGFARQLTQPSPETRSGARLRPSQTLTLGGSGKTVRPRIAGGLVRKNRTPSHGER